MGWLGSDGLCGGFPFAASLSHLVWLAMVLHAAAAHHHTAITGLRACATALSFNQPFTIMSKFLCRGASRSPQAGGVTPVNSQHSADAEPSVDGPIHLSAHHEAASAADLKRLMPSSGAEQSASPVSFFASRGLGTHHNRFLLGRHRLRHQPTAGTACPPRLRWQPIRQQHQLLYDAALPKRSAAQKLWRVVQPVRAALTEDGTDQSRLDRASGALEVCGVIYAIYCLRSRRMYVGQTMEPCFKRFMSHVRAAYRGGTELFHLAIRRFGWQNFVCFPLEVLPAVAPSRHQSRVARFRQVADAREAFWIERLHTWAPRGYNSAVRARNRPGRHRRFNPMRRHVCSDRPVARPHMQDMSKDKRWYGSRDWERFCAGYPAATTMVHSTVLSLPLIAIGSSLAC